MLIHGKASDGERRGSRAGGVRDRRSGAHPAIVALMRRKAVCRGGNCPRKANLVTNQT
jgi:hypothetical protein